MYFLSVVGVYLSGKYNHVAVSSWEMVPHAYDRWYRIEDSWHDI